MGWFRKNKANNLEKKESQSDAEFKQNLEMLEREYGKDLGGLTYSQATGRMIADLLKRVKELESKNERA
ncbi:MAG: hypothetical protein AABY15_03070 [Nanoarchaeota archaeon]